MSRTENEAVITLSFGRTANFVSQHYWNIEHERVSEQQQTQWTGNFREVKKRQLDEKDTNNNLIPRHVITGFSSDNGPTPWNELDVSQVVPTEDALNYDTSLLNMNYSSSTETIYKPYKREMSFYHNLKQHQRIKGSNKENNQIDEMMEREYANVGAAFFKTFQSLRTKENEENKAKFCEEISDVRYDYYALDNRLKNIKNEKEFNNLSDNKDRLLLDRFSTDYAEIEPSLHDNIINIKDWSLPERVTPILGSVSPNQHPFYTSKYAQNQFQSVRRNKMAFSGAGTTPIEVPKVKIEEDFYESVRRELENCDHCNTYQIFTTGDDCWSSISTTCIEQVIDSFSKRAQILLYDIDDHFQDSVVDVRPSIRSLNRAVLYGKLASITDNSLIVPMTTRWSQRSDWELSNNALQLERSQYNKFYDNLYTATSLLGLSASGIMSSIANENQSISTTLNSISPCPIMNILELKCGLSTEWNEGRANSKLADIAPLSLSFSDKTRSFEYSGVKTELFLSPAYSYSWSSTVFRPRRLTQNGSRSFLDSLSVGHRTWMKSWQSFLPQNVQGVFGSISQNKYVAFTDSIQKIPESFPHIFKPYCGNENLRYRMALRSCFDLRCSPDLRLSLRNEGNGFGFGILYKDLSVRNPGVNSEEVNDAYNHLLNTYNAYMIPGMTRLHGSQSDIIDPDMQCEWDKNTKEEILDGTEFGYDRTSEIYQTEIMRRRDARALSKILCNEEGLSRDEIEMQMSSDDYDLDDN